jgi:hypothetical protein
MTPGQPFLRLRVFPSGLRTFRRRSIYFPSTLLSPLHVEKLHVSPHASVEELVVLRLEVEFCHWRSSGVWSELLGRARICLRHLLIPLTLGPASECFLLTEAFVLLRETINCDQLSEAESLILTTELFLTVKQPSRLCGSSMSANQMDPRLITLAVAVFVILALAALLYVRKRRCTTGELKQ